MRARATWRQDRRHVVPVDSLWEERGKRPRWQWRVVELFRFEAGSNGWMLAVRIRHEATGRERSMSEARFVRIFEIKRAWGEAQR